MNLKEIELLKNVNDELSSDLILELVLPDGKPYDEISEFCDQLSDTASKIIVNRKNDETVLLPGIKVHDRLIFHAVPTGTEFEPFIEAIRLAGGKSLQISDDENDQLKKIEIPAMLKLFVSGHCPFCPKAATMLIPLIFASENVRLAVIDGMIFQELSQTNGIQSVPTLLLDDDFRWAGNIPISEVINIMINRDPLTLSATSIESLIKDGRAIDVAQMMLEHKAVFPGLLNLLTDKKWSTRLGAMVVMESVIDYDKNLALRGIGFLWDKIQEIDGRAVGDLLYLFGLCGNASTLKKIKEILSLGVSDDIRESAEEAIAEIKTRGF